MYKSDELEVLPEQIVSIFSALENDIMQDIIARIRENDEFTRTADWEAYRLYQMGKPTVAIKKEIQEALNLSDSEIERLYSDVIKEGYARDENLYKAAGKQFVQYEENEQLQQLIKAVKEQTNNEFVNITNTTGFVVKNVAGKKEFVSTQQYLQKVLDGATMHILNGTYNYNQIIKKVVDEMTNSGVRTVNYESGKSDRIDVAARRAVITGVNQVTGKINEDNIQKLDTEFVETSWHSTARPTHQLWQGGVFYWNKGDENAEMTVDGILYKSFIKETGYGTVEGLCGANCYHTFYPFILGVSTRNYTDEELDKMNAAENEKKIYNGKEYTKYEATQYQRKLERLMRKQRQDIKLLKDSGLTDEDDEVIYAKCRYQGTSSKYSNFSKAMELEEHRERVTVDGLRNIGHNKTISESEQSARRSKDNDYTVKWNRIRTSQYKEKFSQLTNEPKAANLLYTRAKWALSNRDGLNTEELYAVNLSKGKDIASITNQQIPNGVIRTKEFNSKLKLADDSGDNVLLIHNHPRGLPPSISDINALLKNKNVSGITIGHDGNIYHYTRPNKAISEIDFEVAIRKYSRYTEITNMEKALEELSRDYGFRFSKL